MNTNDSNAYGQRGFDCSSEIKWEYNLPLRLSYSVKERDEYQRLIFKAAANDNYPLSRERTFGMHAYT